MRLTRIAHQHVEYIPDVLEEGVLYISLPFKTALHRCACGCGQEVVTPLGQAEWSLRETGGKVTLYPSIGNWSFPCQSHYFIRGSQIAWVGKMTKAEIARGRQITQERREVYLQAANKSAERTGAGEGHENSTSKNASPISFWIWLVKAVRKFWMGK